MRTTEADGVTTVVMTRNRLGDLMETLPHHQAPVIVIDNGSTTDVMDRVERAFPEVQTVRLPCNYGAAARNIGVAMARTPYVAFADDDSWWAPGALAVAADVLDRHPDIGLVAARILVGADQRPDPITSAMESSPFAAVEAHLSPVYGFSACGAITRREAFLAAGGFDPLVFFAGEEERLALDLASLGWRLCFVPDVVAHHYPSRHRAPRSRRAAQARNRVLTAVMRRPWCVVWRRTARTLRDPAGVVGLLGVGPRLRRGLAARRPVPAAVEAELRRLDDD